MTPSTFIKHHFLNICCGQRPEYGIEGINWQNLFLPLRKYRLESLLFPLHIPELQELENLYKQAYDVQISYLQSIADPLGEIPGFTLIQGFPWNDSFEDGLPLSIRGDIDVLVPQENAAQLHEKLKRLGFEKRVFIDGALTSISEQLSQSISDDIPWDYPKNMPYSKLLEIPNLALEYFELGSIFGPLVKSKDSWFLSFLIEETYSFGYPKDTDFFASKRLTEPFLGLRRSNLYGLLLTAAIRVSISIRQGRLRLRTVLEAATHMEALAKTDSLSTLIEISDELGAQQELFELIEAINHIAGGTSRAAAQVRSKMDGLNTQSTKFVDQCLAALDQEFLQESRS